MSSDSHFPVAPAPGGAPARRVELDNLIRRELRVGDPSDPVAISQALMQRYAATPTARSLVNEARGLPFLQTVTLAPPAPVTHTATSLDMRQAKDDVEADIEELLTSNQLKDITPELEGWAEAIRAAIAEGEAAAGMALDTLQRDKTFAVRRLLGDYARAARLVASFNNRSRAEFRNLAQSLDEVSAVLLVMAGEAIANTGIAGGRYLLEVPFSELQARRETVLQALRNLLGSTHYAYGQSEFPRGIDAYRKLFRVLDEQGLGDVRTLLNEGEMARAMDQLIDRAGHGVRGLRSLGSTARLDLQRFRRLDAAIAWNLPTADDAPPMLAFREALQLFMDGFSDGGGIRLVTIARPAILTYGLYGNTFPAAGSVETRLLQLLAHRGALAARLDCLGDCGCDEVSARQQVLLDMSLANIDRAVDLYATGSDADVSEIRAGAYKHLLTATADKVVAIADRADLPSGITQAVDLLKEAAGKLHDKATTSEHRALMLQELDLQRSHELDLRHLTEQLVDGCGTFDLVYGDKRLTLGGDVHDTLEAAGRRIPDSSDHARSAAIHLPATQERSMERLADIGGVLSKRSKLQVKRDLLAMDSQIERLRTNVDGAERILANIRASSSRKPIELRMDNTVIRCKDKDQAQDEIDRRKRQLEILVKERDELKKELERAEQEYPSRTA